MFIWALLKQRLDPLLCFFVHFVETDEASALQFIVFVVSGNIRQGEEKQASWIVNYKRFISPLVHFLGCEVSEGGLVRFQAISRQVMNSQDTLYDPFIIRHLPILKITFQSFNFILHLSEIDCN